MYFTTRVGWYSGTTEKNIMENCNKSKVEEKKLQNLFENDWKQNGFRRAINNRIGGNAGGRAYTVAAKPRYARHACNNSSISSGGSNNNNIKNAKWLCEDIRILAYSLEFFLIYYPIQVQQAVATAAAANSSKQWGIHILQQHQSSVRNL